MKVRYIGKTNSATFTNGKEYEVLSVEHDWLRIVDETEEDYLYPPTKFEIIEDENGEIAKAMENMNV